MEVRPIDTNDVLLVGYGKLPHNTSAEQMHQVLAIAVRFDPVAGRVVDASTTLATRVADEFISGLLIGLDLTQDAAAIVQRITASYHGHAQRAVLAAFRDLIRQYQEVTVDPPLTEPVYGR